MNARRSVSSLPTASGNSSDSESSAGGRRPRIRAAAPPLARPQARWPSELAQLALAPRLERDEPEWERRQELVHALVGDDQNLPGTRDVRGRESCEPALGSARAWVPGSADGGKRTLERGLQPAVETLHSPRLEIDTAEIGGLDRETRILERPQDLLPGLLGRGGILLDEHESRAGRERLAHPHPWPDAERIGGRGHRPDQRLFPGRRRERGGPQRDSRASPQRCP